MPIPIFQNPRKKNTCAINDSQPIYYFGKFCAKTKYWLSGHSMSWYKAAFSGIKTELLGLKTN